MIREAFDDLEEGIIIAGKLIKEIQFADEKKEFWLAHKKDYKN